MKKKITKRVVEAARPTGKRLFIWDTEVTGFGLMVTPSGSKSYVFQYRLPGRGRRATAKRLTLGKHGDLTPDEARRFAADHLLAVKGGGDPVSDRRPGESRTVEDLARRFLADYLPNKKKPPRPKTIDYYDDIFRCHVTPTLGSVPVEEITRQDIEGLHQALRNKPYMANRVVTVLGQAFDYAEILGWRTQGSNPTRHVERYRELRRGAKKEVMLTPEQMKNLLDAINKEEEAGGDATSCAAIRVAFWTGWRISEVLRLEWGNVDLKTGSTKLLLTKTAGEEYRQMPSEALEVVKQQQRVAGCPYVFPGRYLKGHLTTVKGPWLRIRKRAKLDNLDGLGALRLHDLRHNVVSWDVSRGVPLEIAGKNVGHRSRDATEVYAHFAPDALKKAADERARAMREAVEDS